MSPSQADPRILLIHDDRPGHRSQLAGMESGLQSLCASQITWKHYKAPIDRPLRADIIIGAGRRTHRSVLKHAKTMNAMSVSIMKPGHAIRRFDALICPTHDYLKESKYILNTCGAINTLSTHARQTDAAQSKQGLILLGGPSKHFVWDQASILDQVQSITEDSTLDHWTLCDSPRSTTKLRDAIEKLSKRAPHLSYAPYESTSKTALEQLMLSSRECWVSPDSVSMIYESLSAGCATGSLHLKPKIRLSRNRVLGGLQELVENQTITSYDDWERGRLLQLPHKRFNEAKRAANWLLERYRDWREYTATGGTPRQ